MATVLIPVPDRDFDPTEVAVSAPGTIKRTLVLKALRKWAAVHQSTWDVTREDDKYVRAATASAKRGYRVVVYGHTHLVKRVALGDGATYLNAGTWADLMRFPDGIEP